MRNYNKSLIGSFFLMILIIQACTSKTLSQNYQKDVFCYLEKNPIEYSFTLIKNLVRANSNISGFENDSSDYSIVYLDADTISLFSIKNGSYFFNDICLSSSNIMPSETKELMSALEFLSSLNIGHRQKIKDHGIILSEELSKMLFIKEKGILVYSYIGLPGCDIHMNSNEADVMKNLNQIFKFLDSLSLSSRSTTTSDK